MANSANVFDEDGGAHAIKGFLYQYDKTIIALCADPNATVTIESVEDLGAETWCMQVKHYPGTPFSPSRIRKAVNKLLLVHQANPSQDIELYCYFKNKPAGQWRPTEEQLHQILGKDHGIAAPVLETFSRRFVVNFSAEDYAAQFVTTVEYIEKAFSLNSREVAIIHHAMLRAALVDIIVHKPPKERYTTLNALRAILTNQVKVLTLEGYEQYLAENRYVAMVRKEFFAHRTANIDNIQRLFVIQSIPEPQDIAELMGLMKMIAQHYHRPNKSPAPFISVDSLSEAALLRLKQMLLEDGFAFTDGCRYVGHTPRFEDILMDNLAPPPKIRYIELRHWPDLAGWGRLRKVFIFCRPNGVRPNIARDVPHVHIGVKDFQQAAAMIAGPRS